MQQEPTYCHVHCSYILGVRGKRHRHGHVEAKRKTLPWAGATDTPLTAGKGQRWWAEPRFFPPVNQGGPGHREAWGGHSMSPWGPVPSLLVQGPTPHPDTVEVRKLPREGSNPRPCPSSGTYNSRQRQGPRPNRHDTAQHRHTPWSGRGIVGGSCTQSP